MPTTEHDAGSSPSRRLIDPSALTAVLRRLARHGDAPWLHREVARRMAERLPVVRLQPGHVVDWWSFLGGGAPLLRDTYPRACLTVVEPTPALQARSQAALTPPWWTPGRWLSTVPQAVLEDAWPPVMAAADASAGPHSAADVSVPVQLVWSNMMLHAAIDPPAVLTRWHRLLSAGGFAMFSCFGPDTVRELRELYAPLGRAAGIAFVDMHDLGDMMVQAGFADPVMDQETITLHWDSPAALLAELRSLGGNVAPARPAGLHTARWRAALEREIESLRRTDGRLAMRFEIIYGHAFKAPPRLGAPGETRVSVDAMREMVRAGRTAR